MILAPSQGGAPEQRQRTGVADILRTALEQGLVSDSLHPQQAKVLRRICACRTAALGGHADVCLDCGKTSYSYNSCRDRHCPRCQHRAGERWVAGRQQRLLDTHYFHVVFTMPAQLRPLAMRHPAEVYCLLLKTASHTLLELAETKLGATLGVTSVLHTWTRELTYHPHVHCLVTGGGLSLDQKRWRSARRKYLFAVKQMGALFRGKFLAGLRRLFEADKLDGIGARDFDELLELLYRKDWGVYAKRPMAGPEQVIKYLGHYTHRVAISNSRIVNITSTHVTFYTHKPSTKTLTIGEFARRFLQHVLPHGFTKIRHYGLFAASNIKKKWAVAHGLRPHRAVADDPSEPEPDHPPVCEHCGSERVLRIALEPYPATYVVPPKHPRGPPAHLQLGGRR